jgi:hypothetical protein
VRRTDKALHILWLVRYQEYTIAAMATGYTVQQDHVGRPDRQDCRSLVKRTGNKQPGYEIGLCNTTVDVKWLIEVPLSSRT